MHSESFEEIFTYIGQAPEPTPEKKKEREEASKRMDEDLERQIQRIKKGVQFNGTRYGEEDLKRLREWFGEIEEPTEEDLKMYREQYEKLGGIVEKLKE